MSFILSESHDQSEARTINIASAAQSENVRACVRLFIYFVRPGRPTALKEHVTHLVLVFAVRCQSDWRQSSLNKIRLRS